MKNNYIKGSWLYRIFAIIACSTSPFASSAQTPVTVTSQINASLGDVEEYVSGGSMYTNSSDLELVNDGSDAQVVGLRFTNITIPKNAVITNAYITFRSDGSTSTATSLVFNVQATDNAPAFTSAAFNVSSRTYETGSVSWSSIASWSSSTNYNTPSLASLVQTIVNRSGWASGNSMVFKISGTGERKAVAYDGSSTNAPKLTITYTCSTPTSPTFALGSTSSRCQGEGTVAYTATSTGASTYAYAISNSGTGTAPTINTATGLVTYPASWQGTSTITVTASSCSGSSAAAHTATTSVTPTTPVFAVGASSERCIGSAVNTYTATSPGSTVTYSITNTGSGEAPSIDPSTGQVTYYADWSGKSVITATATGCGSFTSTATATHTITSTSVDAVNDAFVGIQANPLLIDFLENDLCSPDEGSVEIAVDPLNGVVQLSDDGSYYYLPNGSFYGIDSFKYKVCATGSATSCDTATVIITIEESLIDPCAEANKAKIFYLPFPENLTQLRTALTSSSNTNTHINTNVRTIISFKTIYPGTVITYDHWEDGYETNINAPIQSTTQVWGDGNLANGAAPGYPSDLLPSGAVITLDQLFPYSRTTSTIVPDGKDKIATNNDIALSKITGDGGYSSGTTKSFDLQNLKTNVVDITRFGNLFVIPVGEDISTLSPSSTLTSAFKYVGLFVRAAEAGTIVELDYDGNGTVDTISPTLNEGEVWFYNGVGSDPGVTGNINNATDIKAGAILTSNNPVGVDVVFGGIDNFGTRNVAVLPGAFYGSEYYSPVYSTNTTTPAPAYAVFTNSLATAITVNWENGSAGSGSVSIPAKGYATVNMNQAAGYRFWNTEDKSFTAMAVMDVDATSSSYDWAFNMIPAARLSTFASVAWAPGSSDFSANYNPVWVTSEAATTIYVKYDGNMVATGPNISPCGLPYDSSFVSNKLQARQLKDLSDNDNTGLSVFTCDDVKIAAVWGQDVSSTVPTGSPAMDVGYVMEGKCVSQMVFANDDSRSTDPETPVTIDTKPNDVGFLVTLNPGSVSVAGLLPPANGSIVINPNGTITYTPNTGFIGTDYFEYRICAVDYEDLCDVALVAVNVGICAASSLENEISGKVYVEQFATNNGIYDGIESPASSLKVYLYNDISCNGTVDAASDFVVDSTYTDATGFYEFRPRSRFTASDNFDPTAVLTGNDGNVNWTAASWTASSATNVQVLNDAKGNGNAVRIGGGANMYRTLAFSNASPNALINFSYRRENINNGSESLQVQVSSNGTTYTTVATIDNGGVYGTNNNYTNHNISVPVYATPTAGQLGTNTTNYIRFVASGTSTTEYYWIDNVSFTYTKPSNCYIVKTDAASLEYTATAPTVDDVSLSGLANCVKTELAVLAKLVAIDDAASTSIDLPVVISVLANEQGKPGESSITVDGLLAPDNGSITINGDGTITYTPNPGFSGTDDFEYQVCSEEDPTLCDIALVTVTVNCAVITPGTQLITGIVYNDDNKDGIYSTGETGFEGATMNLYNDANGNGILDASENTPVQSMTTTNTGGYNFQIIAPISAFTVRDEFTTIDGTGNNGTTTWLNNWTKVGDAGGFNTGDVQIPSATGTFHNTNMLAFRSSSNGATRSANLTGATTATLTFDFKTDELEEASDEILNIEVASTSSPATWTPLGSLVGTVVGNNASGSRSFSIPAAAVSGTTTIRFITSSGTGTDHFYVDNVQIAYTLPPVTNNYIVQMAQPIPTGYELTQPTPSPSGIHTAAITGAGSDCQNNFGLNELLAIKGTVFIDGNGLNGSPANTVDGVEYKLGSLYATLLASDGTVLDNVAVSTVDGTYIFSNGITAASYSVMLNIAPLTVGSSVTVPADGAIPSGWASVGDNIGDGSGHDGTPNSFIAVTVTTESVSSVNFAIERIPESNDATADIQVNPGGILTVAVPTLTGNDAEDGAYTGSGTDNILIVTIPDATTGGILYYDYDGPGGAAPVALIANTTINNYNPAYLTVDPVGGAPSISFTYSHVDEAGVTSVPATVSMPFSAPVITIEANDDDYSSVVVNGVVGNTDLGNILTNDLHNTLEATTSLVTININTAATPAYPGANVPTVNTTTGVVSVPVNTPTGTYEIDYSICDTENGSPCDSAIVIVAVFNTIEALDNTYTVSAGTNTSSILANDSLGNQVVNPASITTTSTSVPAGFTLNTDGTVSVAATVVSGSYSFDYQICENGATPANCADATVTLNVLNPIVANDNTYSVAAGDNTASILVNDSLKNAPVNVADITTTAITTIPAGFTLNTDGTVSVDATVVSGSYSFDYQICENGATPANCADATVTLNVLNPIVANDNTYSVAAGDNTASILVNDSLKDATVNVADITTSATTAVPAGFTLNTDGTVSVAATVVSGTYSFDYQICENGATPANCADATVTLNVLNPIIANDNTYSVAAGDNTASILVNDSLKDAPVNVADITTTAITTVPAGFTLNTDGTVSVAATVVSGSYSFDYQICENGATPANCADATVTLNVLNPIVANDNTYSVAAGDNTASILVNDSLKDAAVNVADITTTAITTVPAGFTLNTDGTVSVAATVVSGTYSFDYQICENGATPANCAEATVTLNVLNPIVANDNTFTSTPGSTTTSILTNDSLNGVPVAVEQISVTVTSTMPDGFTLNTDGTISIEATVPYGSYNFNYEICETGATPANCSTASVTIVLDDPLPVNLLYFNVRKENSAALLDWATSSETNNLGFNIEKSQNGRDWTKIGFVETKANNGNSTAQINYHYNDNNPFIGINYYRLKQQDVDGKFEYSVVKQLTFTGNRIIKLYPNPAMDYVIIEGLEGNEELRLMDVSGRVLKTENATTSQAKIMLSNLAAGSYQIQVISDGKLLSSHKVQKTQ